MDYAALTRDNEARSRAAESRGDLVVDAWPQKVFFEFTVDCNLHCFMCGCEMARDGYRAAGFKRFTLPVETFRLVVKKAFPHLSIVNPTAVGEPMMLAYFDELLAACREHSVKLELITNGMLLRGQRMHAMMPVLDSVTVSFDGATKATFDHIRTGGDFDVVLKNLEAFRDLRKELGLRNQVRFSFNVTLMHENVEELPDIVRIASRLDVDCLTGNFMLVFGDALRGSSPLRDPARTNHALREARRVARELGMEVRLPRPLPANAGRTIAVQKCGDLEPMEAVPASTPDEKPRAPEPEQPVADPIPEPERVSPPAEERDENELSPISLTRPSDWKGRYYCRFPWRETFVSQGGEVTPCCSPGRPVLGNAFEVDFMSIWNGPEYQRLRKGLLTGELTDYCRNCTYLQESGQLEFRDESYISG